MEGLEPHFWSVESGDEPYLPVVERGGGCAFDEG
jgi:hypothetical protein